MHGSDSPAPVVLTAGGSAANTAAWLAATGTPTVLVGRVGADLAGDAAVSALERVGVTVHLARDPDRPTGTCIVLVSPEGERTMVPDAGANAALARSDVPAGLFDPASHLHLSGYALLNDGSRDAARHAIGARARGRCHREPRRRLGRPDQRRRRPDVPRLGRRSGRPAGQRRRGAGPHRDRRPGGSPPAP